VRLIPFVRTICFLLSVLLFAWSAGKVQPQGVVYFFEGARLIPGDGSVPIENSAFIVANGRFIKIGRNSELRPPAGAIRVDLTGKTVIPGLIDAHAHLGYANYRNWTDGKRNYTRENLLDHLHRAAYFGLSSVYSPGTDIAPLCYEVRDEVLSGKIPNVARWITSGPGLTTPDSAREDTQRQDAYAISTPEQARKAVRELAAHNVTVVKAWVNSGGGNTFAKQPMTPDVYAAFIDETHRQHMRVWVHDRVVEVAKGLIRAGVDGFAHEIDDIGASPEYLKSKGRPPGPDAELLKMLKEKGPKIFMTLTQPTFPGADADRFREPDPLLTDTVPPEVLEKLRTKAMETPTPAQKSKAQKYWEARKVMTQELVATGIRIGTGSDSDHLANNFASMDAWGRLGGLDMIGWAEHAEMEEMVASGMSPAQVIVAATKTNAEWLGLDDLGTIAAHKTASFVVLDANPLDDIRNTRRIHSVYLGGIEVDRAGLKAAWAKL
jgi:imidazolonepropionase-like amidohydrolase